MSNKLTKTAKELLQIEEDLRFRLDYSKGEKPTVDDFELYVFEQIWGSTALGFPGVGGDAMTTARTYVLIPVYCNQKCFVYFAGRFAYSADYSELFKQDLAKHQMKSVIGSDKYSLSSKTD